MKPLKYAKENTKNEVKETWNYRFPLQRRTRAGEKGLYLTCKLLQAKIIYVHEKSTLREYSIHSYCKKWMLTLCVVAKHKKVQWELRAEHSPPEKVGNSWNNFFSYYRTTSLIPPFLFSTISKNILIIPIAEQPNADTESGELQRACILLWVASCARLEKKRKYT